MAITFKKYGPACVADVRVSEYAHYAISVIRIENYISASLEVHDLDYGYQGSRVTSEAETSDTRLNIRICLAEIAEWAVRNLKGVDVQEALETVGEAMELVC